jgi:uncharacterized membrane protein YhhN
MSGDELSLALPVATTAALGAAHVVARYAGARLVAGVLKPLPILILAVLVAHAAGGPTAWYAPLVVAGLCCSMAGDVLLVFRRGFVPGLASFLAAHACYTAAFAPLGRWDAGAWLAALPLLVAAAVFLRWLWPHLGRVRRAVVVYAVVIVAMAWRALAAAAVAPAAGTASALAGALLFMVSDGLLATDRFARPFRSAGAAVMITYYAAQLLIAASALV